MPAETDPEPFLGQIERILASKEFVSSRQLRDFLRYVSKRALEGADHLEQSEIAAAVLSKAADFNPLDDASVRKLASMTRQRLEHYYQNSGSLDPVIVALPVRSYLPEFRLRELEPAPVPVPPPVPVNPPPQGWLLPALGVAVLALGCGFALGRAWPGSKTGPASQFAFRTVKGDMYGGALDLPGDAVRLGPKLMTKDQATVRMRFSPTMEAHQAGLILWRDPDNYVKLGRRFMARNMLEFAAETKGTFKLADGTPQHDPDGQDGAPLWLSLKRDGQTVSAYISRDGSTWRTVGAPITVGFDLESSRAGLYAFHGRRDANAIGAEFDHASLGATFGLWTKETAGIAGFKWTPRCAESVAEVTGNLLQLRIDPGLPSCSSALFRPIVGKDWTVRTRIDFLASAGNSAGIIVRGQKGGVRLVRYFGNEPNIAMIQDGRDFSGVRDYPGSPGLILRLACRNGTITGSFSRDDLTWVELPHKSKLSDLGGNLVAGPLLSTSPWGTTRSVPPAEFPYFAEEFLDLQNFR